MTLGITSSVFVFRSILEDTVLLNIAAAFELYPEE